MSGPVGAGGPRPAPPGLAMQLARVVRPWRGLLVVVGLCVAASAVAGIVPPLVVRHVVNANLVPRRAGGLPAAGLTYLAAVAGDAVFSFGYGYLAAVVAQRAIAALRVRLFTHLMRLPVSYFDRTPLGEVISRATADVETIDELFTGGVVTLVGQLVPLVAVVATMITLSPLLSAVAAVVAPPLLLASRWLQVRVRDAERDTRVAVGRLNTQLAETVAGAETITAFGRQEAFVARFRTALGQTLTAQARSVGYNAFFAPVTGMLAALVTAALIWVGAGGTLTGAGVSLGTLTGFVLLFQRFFAPIIALGDEWQAIQAALAGAERVFAVLNLPPDDHPPGSPAGPAGGARGDRAGRRQLRLRPRPAGAARPVAGRGAR